MHLIDKATETLLLKAPDPLMLRGLLPRSKLLAHPDWNFAAHLTMDAVRVLRNVGFDVPAPVQALYDWPGKYKPFAHQRLMVDFYLQHKRCFNLSEMGCGKTAGTLWAIDWLMQIGAVRRVLIISPLSTLKNVWQNDIFDVIPHRTAAVIHGPKDRRLHYLSIPADFYILNHDGVKIPEVMKAIAANPEIDLVVVDEAGMFRNWRSQRYKDLHKLVHKTRPDLRLWLMTGTPCPNEPTDAWALARLVDPKTVPDTFGAFQRDVMVKVSNFKWVPRPDATMRAFKAMQPAIRFKKKDCIDLPPVTTRMIGVPITVQQKDALKALKDKMQADLSDGTQITAANAADKISKMRQVLCGAVKDPNTGAYLPLDFKPRLVHLLELIESASAKVIVIVPFKGIIRLLEPEVSKHFTCAVVNGDVPAAKRNDIFAAFKHQQDPQVILCHPAVMAHGLNLTEADTLIYYAPIYSNDEVEQVNERFNRAGQTRHMSIYRMSGHPIEAEIYKMSDGRKQVQGNILDLYNVAMTTA